MENKEETVEITVRKSIDCSRRYETQTETISKQMYKYLTETDPAIFYFDCGNHDHGPYKFSDIISNE